MHGTSVSLRNNFKSYCIMHTTSDDHPNRPRHRHCRTLIPKQRLWVSTACEAQQRIYSLHAVYATVGRQQMAVASCCCVELIFFSRFFFVCLALVPIPSLVLWLRSHTYLRFTVTFIPSIFVCIQQSFHPVPHSPLSSVQCEPQ